MNLTLSTWCTIYTTICFIVFIIGISYIYVKFDKGYEWSLPALFLFVVFSFFFYLFSASTWFDGGGQRVRVGYNKEDVRGIKDRIVYGELDEIRNTLNNAYDNKYKDLKYTDYYYDYIEVTLTEKTLSIFDLIKYHKSHDYNMIYYSKTNVYKLTGKLELEGILKTKIEDNFTKYTINEYTLGKDSGGKIVSLANNQNVKLEIIYNKEYYKNDNYIINYNIINADTK